MKLQHSWLISERVNALRLESYSSTLCYDFPLCLFGFRVDFESRISDRFKIEFCVHIDFYIILIHFEIRSNWVQLQGQVKIELLSLF